MSDINDRFKEYLETCKTKGITQKKLEEITGIGQSTLSDIKNKNQEPSADTLQKLIRKTDISIEWLLVGTGTMVRSFEPAKIIAEQNTSKYETCGADPELQKIIDDVVEIMNSGNDTTRSALTMNVTAFREAARTAIQNQDLKKEAKQNSKRIHNLERDIKALKAIINPNKSSTSAKEG